MSTQGMKTWKLGLFFVMSLMMVMGLFADVAEAQRATVSVRPTSGDSGEVLDSVRVEYRIKTGMAIPATQDQTPGDDTDDDEAITNTVEIELPTGWFDAATVDTAFGGTFEPSRDGQITGVWSTRTGTEASYVTIETRFARGAHILAANVPTFRANAVSVIVSGGMKVNDRLIVTYHNVKVLGLTDTEIEALTGDPGDLMIAPHMVYFSVSEDTNLLVTDPDDSTGTINDPLFEYDDPAGDDGAADLTTAQQAIKDMVGLEVTLPMQSMVSVRPNRVSAGDELDTVSVTYEVKEGVFEANEITIQLPIDWMPQTIGEADDGSSTFGGSTTASAMTVKGNAHSWTSVATDNPNTTAHITVAARFARRSGGATPYVNATDSAVSTVTVAVDSSTADAEVTVAVPSSNTAPMMRGDMITVTFHKVQVRELRTTEFDESDMIRDKVVVEDAIDGSMYDVSIMIDPPMQSKVTVTPDEVDQGDIVDVKVTYVVQEDMLFGDNNIYIKLPDDWEAAHRANGSDTDETTMSFGTNVIASDRDVASRDRSRTSYVVLTYKFKSEDTKITNHDPKATTPKFLDIGASEYNAYVDISVTGGMVKGDMITVTFNNVMVEALEAVEPMNVSVTVSDSIPGADYASMTMIKVIPPKLGNVRVTPDAVTAESTVNLMVRYTATKALADDDTFGRIRIQLPEGWGSADPDDDEIYLKRQAGKPNATYLSLAKSSGVTLTKITGNPDGLNDVGGTETNGYMIDIDVDKMTTRQQVTLTVHNLMINALATPRDDRYTDITTLTDKVQVMVSSSKYASAAARDTSDPTHSPATVSPKDAKASETQPTIKVNRKTLGEVAVAPATVTAGDKVDFTITYKATEAMAADDVIEIKLPAGWAAPTVYQLADTKPTKEQKIGYVYLSGSASRLAGTEIDIIDDPEPGDKNENGWVVQIRLGKAVSKNSTVVLKYSDATVQRSLATGDDKLVVETFSGPLTSSYPQFPVKELVKDTIEVKHAADGSGMVTFEYDGNNVTSMSGKDHADVALVSNTDMSIPAGLDKDDLRELVVKYEPAGDMGTGEFEFRLPSGWKAESVRVSGGDKEVSGNTVTVDFDAHFGEADGDVVEITFADITVPTEHGEVGFTAKSKNAGGTLKQLSPRPMAFVGNAEATHDTVAVTITPTAAYENWDDVRFEIELTNAGPMHDSEIRITVPEGLSGLRTDKPAEANYVKMLSTTARSVRLSTLDIISEDIIIKTGKLNANGRIRILFDNVDLEDVSTDAATGFRVATRTRGSGLALTDLDYASLDDEDYVDIQKADGGRSIAGGFIRTINGSGTMVVEPMIIEQNARNQTIKLTYTAATTFDKKDLIIQVPSVIGTELQETNAAGKGHVSTTTARFHADIKAADRLKIEGGNTIKWTGVKLRQDQTFVTMIKRVDLLEYTGNDFRWVASLGGVDLLEADNKPMVVVGTTAEDVAFNIVENGGVAVLAPSYPAASKQSIRFQFTAESTTIEPGGSIRFTVPGRWTLPSLTDRAGRATVSIVSEDDDGNEILVSELPKTGDAGAGNKMKLTTSGRSVTLTIGAKGGIARGGSVTIQYGTADLTKFPIQIPSSVAGTSGNFADGLAIHGSYRVSGETGFRQRSAGTVWVDVTNVEDGTGTVSVTPPSVRASSTDNLIRITYTAVGTMDGGAVHLIIPDSWGAAQSSDNTAANYVNVTAAGNGAVLTDYEVLNSGRSVEANLKTFAEGSKVMFSYGGGAGPNIGAAAQAEIGDATFIVQSRGSSGGDFVDITDADSLTALTIDVKGAASGSGTVAVSIEKNKSGEVVYDTATGAERRIFAGDDKTYLLFTYTAEQSIAEGELEFMVPMGWTAPQQEDTNQAGYTYLEQGNALVSEEEYNGQSVTATIAMERGDAIKIHYGWYATEDGGAHAPSAAGTSVFQVKFDGIAAVTSLPSVIVHGGTASKLVVTAPSSVSADPGAVPGLITVEIQDDTDAAAVLGSDLAVTLSSTNTTTGSFADADGAAIVNNMVTISAGSTQATAHYSDTGAGTTATVRATAVGLDSGRATIEVTSDIDRVDANSVSVSSATAKAGDSVTVSASGTAGKTATFSVGAVVTTMTMTESPAGSGSYSGSFTVVQDQHDGTHNVTVNIGDASDMVANAITIDTSAPTISSASASPATVGNGDAVTITAMVTDATSVTADVSALDSTQTSVTLTMANGTYSASVTISDDNAAKNGEKTITVTAMDAAGNSEMATVMVTLDNKLSYTSMIPAGQSLFHVPLAVDGLDTVGDLKARIGNDVLNAIVYDAASGNWNARADDMAITAGLGILLVMGDEASVTFEGQAWGDGTASLSLGVGSNLVGLGVNDARVTNVSDIMGLFPAGAIASITVSTGDGFAAVTAAGAAGDGPVMGDAAYLISVPGPSAPPPVALIGAGWSNGGTAAAPIALPGYNVDGQTAALDVSGAVVDEITGLAKEGFRAKVKNLSTKAALSKVTSAETAEGYNMTFVDLKAGNAARVGDVLEISADSPNPLIGVKPVRHIVTVDDVKNSRVMLENLIAYEIPAETELLRNYPNPFNPETWIPYHLSEDADVRLTIYSINGEVVRDIDVGHQTAAKYDTRSKAIYWDGRNQFGEQVASGIYFYSLSAGDFSATRKMVILK